MAVDGGGGGGNTVESSSSNNRSSSSNSSLLAATVATVVALALYVNTLEADFAYDDSRAIKTNPDLLPSTSVTNLFLNDFWGTPLVHSGSHKSYRPLCVLSFRINYYFGQLEPFGYHLVNVLLHGVVTFLFTRMVARYFRLRAPVFVAGVLFAVHPVHTEAVAGVVGRADVGACLFFLLALNSYANYCKQRDAKSTRKSHHKNHSNNKLFSESSPFLHDAPKWRFVSLFAALVWCTCSMLTKEHGITVLAVCATYDVLVHSRVSLRELGYILFEKKYRGLCEGLASLGGSLLLLVSLRLHFMGNKPPDFAPADNPASDSDILTSRLLTFFYLPAFNLWLLVWPRWLSFDWSMEAIPLVTSPFDVRNLMSLAFYLCLGRLAYQAIGRPTSKKSKTSNGVIVNNVANNSVVHNGCSTSVMSINHNYYKTSSTSTSKKTSTSSSKTNNVVNSSHSLNSSPNSVFANSSTQTQNNVSHNALTHAPLWSSHHSTFYEGLAMALAFMVLPFLPATNLFFYVGFVVAERVLYIPSMGYCLLIAIGFNSIYVRCLGNVRNRRVLFVSAILVMCVLCARTVTRNMDWKTEENLYRSGIPINPPKAYGNMANILSAQGKKEEAEWAYKKALSYRSNMADVHYNLGILLQEQKRYDEALQSYKLAIQFRPRMAMAHLNLGLVLGILGRKDEAQEVYRHCSQLDGTGLKDPRTHETTKISALFNLGRLLADDSKYGEAIAVYKEAVNKMPLFYQPQSLYNMLGEAYFKLERFDEAEVWYKEALKAKPDHVPAHLTYGKMLARQNRMSEAENWFARAKSLAPNDSSVYQHYGQFLAEAERHAEAAEHYIRAAELSPDEYEIVFNAANTLRQAGMNDKAERYYRHAVRLRPSEATSHMNLGAMLHVNGKLLEAEQSYLEALKLKPEDHVTKTNLQKLRNLLVKKGLRTNSDNDVF